MAVTMPEHNKRLVRRALEEICAKGSFELANEVVHPDFVYHEPAHPDQPTGPESVKQTARHLTAPSAAFGSRSRTRCSSTGQSVARTRKATVGASRPSGVRELPGAKACFWLFADRNEPKLGEEAEVVPASPMVDDLVVGDPPEVDVSDGELPARRLTAMSGPVWRPLMVTSLTTSSPSA
jgi:hypothetical protein